MQKLVKQVIKKTILMIKGDGNITKVKFMTFGVRREFGNRI